MMTCTVCTRDPEVKCSVRQISAGKLNKSIAFFVAFPVVVCIFIYWIGYYVF